MKPIDTHIQKVQAEIEKKIKFVIEREDISLDFLLESQQKLQKLGQCWQWLNMIKVELEKEEVSKSKIVVMN